MKYFYHILAALLLLFNGTGAIYGGWSLMAHPDGSGLQLPLSLLQHSSFHDYFIPGLVLFTVNGVCSLLVLVALLLRLAYYSRLVLWQGVLLTGWMLTQLTLMGLLFYLQLLLLAIGLALMWLGGRAIKQQN